MRRMRRSTKILCAVVLVLAASVGGAWLGFYLGVPAEEGVLDPQATPAVHLKGADAARFAKQGENQCGAYSLAEGLRLRGVSVTGAELVPRVAHEISWSETLSGTMPWKVIEEARARGVLADGYTARGVAPERRLDVLRFHLRQGRPVILLLESERRSQHFVLLVGYGTDGFFEYDPNFTADPKDPTRTVDENGEALPGNRTLSPERLLEMWGKGGIAGLYTWWYVPLG